MADDAEVPEVQVKKKRVRIAKKGAAAAGGKIRSQPKTIEEFYDARARAPDLFTINEKGDLVAAPVKEGVDVQRIFTLPVYRELTTKEKIELEVKRRETIAAAEEAVQEAQHILREKLLAYRNGEIYASDVVLANIEVDNKEKELQSKAWQLRKTDYAVSIDTNKILLDMPYEERKMGHAVYQLKRYPINLQDQYVTEAPLEAEEPEVLANPTTTTTTENETRATQQPMTAADRGRLGGILKIRRKKF